MLDSYSSYRIGNLTGRQLILSILNRAQAYSEENITEPDTLAAINEVVDELAEIGSFANATEYGMTLIVPENKYVSFAGNRAGVKLTGFSYNASTRQMVVPATGSGLIWYGADIFNASFIGAYVSITIKGATYITEIESIVNNTTVVLKAFPPGEAPTNLTANELLELYISPDAQVSNIDIGTMNIYKYIDYVTSIHDSGIKRACKMLKEKEFLNIKDNNDTSSPYHKDIIWFRKGSLIFMSKGASVSAYGVRTMYFVRTPLPLESENDLIDVKPAHNGQVKALTIHRLLEKSKAREIPADVQLAFDQFMAQKKARIEELAAKEELN